MSVFKNLGSVEIPLQEGEKWAARYRDASLEDEQGKKKVTGYLIPLETLKLVTQQEGIDAVRAYKGINNDGEQILMFVGTKLNKETGIYEDVFFNGNGVLTRAPEPIIYDATRPVPPYGDPNSPMG